MFTSPAFVDESQEAAELEKGSAPLK